MSFASGWVTLEGERAAIPPIRLQALRTFAGHVRDREGRPIDGARVFLPGGQPSAATDAQGRFELKGIPPGKTLLLAEKPGYRLRGWPIDPSAPGVAPAFALGRTTEPADPAIKPQADPISPEESRALADRMMEPYLHDVLEKGDDITKTNALGVLSEVDPQRAVELLQKGLFQAEARSYLLRGDLAERLYTSDPARAMALVESVTPPMLQIENLTRIAQLLPASERARKRELLERATALIPKVTAGLQQRLRSIITVSGGWLDMNEPDRARPLLQEGKTPIYDPLPPGRAPGDPARPSLSCSRSGLSPTRPNSASRISSVIRPTTPVWRRPPCSSRSIDRPRPSGSSTCGRSAVSTSPLTPTPCSSSAAWRGPIHRVLGGSPHRSTDPAKAPAARLVAYGLVRSRQARGRRGGSTGRSRR